MLWTITIILFILWVLGLVSSYTLGGWIHILLVLAVIVLIFNLLQGDEHSDAATAGVRAPITAYRKARRDTEEHRAVRSMQGVGP